MWDYDEEDGILQNKDGWEVKINSNHHSYYDTKEDAVEDILYYLMEEIELKDNITNINSIENFEDIDDLYNFLIGVDSSIFCDIIEEIKEYFDYLDDIILINLDVLNPIFGEL